MKTIYMSISEFEGFKNKYLIGYPLYLQLISFISDSPQLPIQYNEIIVSDSRRNKLLKLRFYENSYSDGVPSYPHFETNEHTIFHRLNGLYSSLSFFVCVHNLDSWNLICTEFALAQPDEIYSTSLLLSPLLRHVKKLNPRNPLSKLKCNK